MTRSTVLTASLAAALSFAAANYSPNPDDGCPGADPTPLALPADPSAADLAARSAAKDGVTREVLAGRMTLPEAAARFARLNALPPRSIIPRPDILAMTAGLPDPGDCTEAEWAAVQVAVRVAVLTARVESPERAREVKERVWSYLQRAKP